MEHLAGHSCPHGNQVSMSAVHMFHFPWGHCRTCHVSTCKLKKPITGNQSRWNNPVSIGQTEKRFHKKNDKSDVVIGRWRAKAKTTKIQVKTSLKVNLHETALQQSKWVSLSHATTFDNFLTIGFTYLIMHRMRKFHVVVSCMEEVQVCCFDH